MIRTASSENETLRRRRRHRRLSVYGGLIAGIVGFYFYQPQRINFFPTQAPTGNPQVDPEQRFLFSRGVRIALIQAHPDDSEFFLGPLLLRFANSGAEIHQLVMTDGDKGFYFWARGQAQKNRQVREAEQRSAASHYAKDVTFLHRPDGRLAGEQDNVAQVASFIQRVRPDYVLAFDSDYWPRVNHADHLASGRAAWEAVMQRHASSSVRYMLLYDTSAPNFIPEVSDTLDEGMAMLAIHKSQFYGERLETLRNMLMNRWYEAGQSVGEQFGIPIRVVKVGA